ncbi:3689_t:CDS:2, partial [Racocetra fulgida]
CKESNIKCQRVLPKTKEEFAVLEKLGLTYVSGQYESTDSGKLHEQAYFQFDKRQTIKKKRTLARWKASELSNAENGFWAFGNYRYLSNANEFTNKDDINEKRLEDMNRIDHIVENNLTVEDILKNKKDLLLRSWLRSLKDLEYLIMKEKENVTLEQITYMIGEHNTIEEHNGIRYYNHNFNSQVDKFELTDHRKENNLDVDTILYPEVRRKLENRLHTTKRKKVQFKGYNIENKLEYIIQDLDNDEKYDSDRSMSSLSSNDSETTRRRKKGKAILKEH